jgi:acyl-CoA synthetase (NDP forming)
LPDTALPTATMPAARLQAGLASAVAATTLAVVGARESSRWCQMFMANLPIYRFAGRVHLVSRDGAAMFGQPGYISCASIGEPIDLAVLMTRPADTQAALADIASARIRAAIVLAGGYQESGPAGADLERALVTEADRLGVTLIGPNCLGLANLLERVPAWVAPVPEPCLPGAIALISQSGNIAQAAAGLAASQGIGLSHIVSTGNEAMITASDVMQTVLEDDRVRVIAMFLESIRDPAVFMTAARRAANLRKPVVILKIGSSDLAKRVAETHTGALAGDDRTVDGVFRSLGVIRVSSLEQLVATAGLLAHTGPLPTGGVGVLSVSGGSNDIVADRAAELGLDLPEFSPGTVSRIRPHSGPSPLMNPLDVGGGAGRNRELWVDTCRAMADDPGLAIVLVSFSRLAHALRPSSETIDEERLGWVCAGLNLAGGMRRSAIMLNTLQPVSLTQLDQLRHLQAPHVLGGIEHGLAAVADAMRWSRWLRRAPQRPVVARRDPDAARESVRLDVPPGAWPEWKVLQLLAGAGIPVVPFRHASSAGAAVAAARELGYPVVVKVSSADVLHKSRVGGVVLDVRNDDEVVAAVDRVLCAAQQAGSVHGDGILISRFLPGGTGLLLGMVADPRWGDLLMLGDGGVDAESLARTTIRLLPVDADDVADMLAELGYAQASGRDSRSGRPDLSAAIDIVLAFADLAAAAGNSIRSLEINPLRVSGSDVHALDGVVVWRSRERDRP